MEINVSKGRIVGDKLPDSHVTNQSTGDVDRSEPLQHLQLADSRIGGGGGTHPEFLKGETTGDMAERAIADARAVENQPLQRMKLP